MKFMFNNYIRFNWDRSPKWGKLGKGKIGFMYGELTSLSR